MHHTHVLNPEKKHVASKRFKTLQNVIIFLKFLIIFVFFLLKLTIMREIKFLIITLLFLLGTKTFAANVWLNDLRSLYTSNKAIIYEINIRTFNANDKDGNGIIGNGEEKGTFINAIKRLDELSDAGINTIKLLPVLPVGKVRALGTAGSLFAPVDFKSINPQFKTTRGTTYEDMARFINECHKRHLRVIVDLPCCAGYDLYTKNPSLFLKDGYGKPVIPQGYDDVRILDAGLESNINQKVYQLYNDFTKMMVDLSVDGISVSMPETKPYSFWKKLIDDTRRYDSEMLFLAEINPNSKQIFPSFVSIISKNRLLDAGFDGYSGDYKNIQSTKNELVNLIKNDVATSQKYNNKKSAYTNFSSYDSVAPIVANGEEYVRQLIWFEATMPFNMYYIDGFSSGDNYMYPLSNKKASVSFTDDNYYYMKRGQIDIYNFSRKPEGTNFKIYEDFVMANKFRSIASEVLSKGSFITLKTNNPNIIAYARSYNEVSVIVIANTEKTEFEKIKVKVPKISNNVPAVPIKVSENVPTFKKGEIESNMAPLEIQVMLLQNFAVK